MKRVIEITAKDDEKQISIKTSFVSTNGLTSWEVQRKVDQLQDDLFSVLTSRFHVRDIRTKP